MSIPKEKITNPKYGHITYTDQDGTLCGKNGRALILARKPGYTLEFLKEKFRQIKMLPCVNCVKKVVGEREYTMGYDQGEIKSVGPEQPENPGKSGGAGGNSGSGEVSGRT